MRGRQVYASGKTGKSKPDVHIIHNIHICGCVKMHLFKDRLSMGVTPVADTFIDTYMATANGEYVKVYLYILRHQNKEDLSLEQIADALNHTEADVKRAINYWQKAGVLEQVQESPAESILIEQNHTNWSMDIEVTPAASKETAAAQVQSPTYSAEQVSRLNNDEEFSQLLYIAQKFLNKAFTPRDCQVFAYLYDTLGMNIGLLEYLAEYCAQNGHTSVRYLETVALSWHEKGIRTALEAQEYSTSYTKDAFAVMKAFGLNSRKPAVPEQKLMEKWFKDYGFDRELVLEACSRTINAIHTPSFQYADSILTDWKKAGVKTLADVKGMDARRAERANNADKRFRSYGNAVNNAQNNRKSSSNQFHNFKQRDTDYDALMLQNVKEWMDSPK